MVLRRFKKDYKSNPNKYTGMPKMPKPRKMSELINYSIPLDTNSWSTKKNLIGINLDSKMRYFYIGKIIKNGKVLDKTIQSVAIKMRNYEIHLSFSYINENEKSTESTIQKTQELDPMINRAGIDIGLNNLISLFIDDKESQSIIVDGARYKYYNSKFNRFIA